MPRTDDEIRADLATAEETQYRFSDAPLHGAAMHRLGADVGPLLERAVAAEQERDQWKAEAKSLADQLNRELEMPCCDSAMALAAARKLMGQIKRSAIAYRTYGNHEGERFALDILAIAERSSLLAAVEQPEPTESYTVEQIRDAYARHATQDDWLVKSFYEGGLIAALRGEYDEPDPTVQGPQNSRQNSAPTESWDQ